tara:strand:+ start:850 stop:1842 length:993 start_codon:yes stop_codon:yes gene_type:complete
MIIKNYEVSQIKFNSQQNILFYGENEGHKNEIINKIIGKKNNILNYEEKEILENSNSFIENLTTNSLFEDEKIILIKRASEKLFKVIEEANKKNLDGITLIINAGKLEKKSKLRTLYEKSKKNIIIAFYPDNAITLSKFAQSYLSRKKISISPNNINLIINKCNGDRGILLNEIKKIESFSENGKKITSEIISKLINLSENHSILELIDNCLAKNTKKIINILNENNFNNDDCIVILRTLLSKSKRVLILSEAYESNNDIEFTISSAKPPIFWKEKDIVKQQVYNWKPSKIKKLIYQINEVELLIKKNFNNSINLLTDFILEKTTKNISN